MCDLMPCINFIKVVKLFILAVKNGSLNQIITTKTFPPYSFLVFLFCISSEANQGKRKHMEDFTEIVLKKPERRAIHTLFCIDGDEVSQNSSLYALESMACTQ